MDSTSNIEVFHNDTGLPPALLPAAGVFAAAATAGLSASVIVRSEGAQARQALAKCRHDVKGALRTLDLAIQSIRSGYRFDDDRAQAKIDAMARALEALRREVPFLVQAVLPEPADQGHGAAPRP